MKEHAASKAYIRLQRQCLAHAEPGISGRGPTILTFQAIFVSAPTFKKPALLCFYFVMAVAVGSRDSLMRRWEQGSPPIKGATLSSQRWMLPALQK